MTGTCLYGYYITFFQRYFSTIQVIPFAGIFKLNLYEISRAFRIGYIAQPIIGIQFIVLPFAATFAAHMATSFI